jgi:hypothetical protein
LVCFFLINWSYSHYWWDYIKLIDNIPIIQMISKMDYIMD